MTGVITRREKITFTMNYINVILILSNFGNVIRISIMVYPLRGIIIFSYLKENYNLGVWNR